jgi:hypothetical protein
VWWGSEGLGIKDSTACHGETMVRMFNVDWGIQLILKIYRSRCPENYEGIKVIP